MTAPSWVLAPEMPIDHDRSQHLGEVVATAGLLLVAFGLNRAGRANLALAVVAAFVGAAYWFSSSTSFANPAVTIGRAFTDSFAGIAPPPSPRSSPLKSAPLAAVPTAC